MNKWIRWLVFLVFLGIVEVSVLQSCQASEVDLSSAFKKDTVFTTENILLGISSVALLADWSTTRDAAGDWTSCGCEETNGYLGSTPSKGKVDRYFLTLLAAHIGINVGIRYMDNQEAAMGIMYGENLMIFVQHGYAAYDNHKSFGLSWKF